eukprot:scaffold144303_cov29-Attheya_sp.AAC.2
MFATHDGNSFSSWKNYRKLCRQKYFSHILDEVYWDDRIGLQHHFKPIPGKGVRQIPLALIQDAWTDGDRLRIVNWWHGMSVEDQRESFKELKAPFITLSVSNESIAGAGGYCNQVSNHQNEDEEQNFQSSSIYMGSANLQESLDLAANRSFSSTKVNSAKKWKTGDTSSTNSQVSDRIVRQMQASAQSIVKRINHVTRTTVGEGDSEVQARTEQVLISITTVATPPKAGFHKKKNQIRRKKKVQIVARDKDTLKDIIGETMVGNFEANCDVFYNFEEGESTFKPQAIS